MKKIILFELNEVPLRVIDQFCAWRPASNLALTLPLCRQHQTYAEDSKLSPWTTWSTLHRGVVDRKHTIHEFGQDLVEINEQFPQIWEILQRQGVSVGVCGSLHTYPLPEGVAKYDFFIPDTFAAGPECFPELLTTFQDFNLQMARDSARTINRSVPIVAGLKVLLKSRELGLRPSTYLDIGGQLLGETFQSWKQVRRRTYQAVLMFDVFMQQLETKRPQFTTFFSNHVASSMHRYWAATFPDDYDSFGFTTDWVSTYRNEIDFTLSKFDQFLGRLTRFVDSNPEYELWITTSMGQAATVAQAVETSLNLRHVDRFFSELGLEPSSWTRRPAMVPQVSIIVREPARELLRNALQNLIINGTPVQYEEHEGGFFSVTVGFYNVHEKPHSASLFGKSISYEQLGLEFITIDDKCGATAYHIPQGSLLVYSAGASQRAKVGTGGLRTEISTLSIAPTILRNFGLKTPDYMADAVKT